MNKETATYILNAMKTRHYKPKIVAHTGNDLNDKNREALDFAIKAIENIGCGCGICLAHNGMKCPILEEGGVECE